MLGALARIASTIAGWLSPERADKRRRKRIKAIQDELRKLDEKNPPTNRDCTRYTMLLRRLSELKKDFTS